MTAKQAADAINSLYALKMKNMDEIEVALSKAVPMLARRVPFFRTTRNVIVYDLVCPRCKKDVRIGCVNIPNFCYHCGQRVTFREVDLK